MKHKKFLNCFPRKINFFSITRFLREKIKTEHYGKDGKFSDFFGHFRIHFSKMDKKNVQNRFVDSLLDLDFLIFSLS